MPLKCGASGKQKKTIVKFSGVANQLGPQIGKHNSTAALGANTIPESKI